jgi:hypothetical protein
MHRLAMPLMQRGLRMGLRSARPLGFRRACADDVAKLCPNLASRRQERVCIQGKRDQLSSECREALDRRREHPSESGH